MLPCDILLRCNNSVAIPAGPSLDWQDTFLSEAGSLSCPKSDLERTLDAALRDRDWLALTLTDVRENEDELRNVLDRAFGAAERNRSSLTEIQLRKSRFDASALTSCKVPVTESGEAGIFRLIFRRAQRACAGRPHRAATGGALGHGQRPLPVDPPQSGPSRLPYS